MKLSDFDYHLPEELIAQSPLEQRDSSRLMVVDRTTGRLTHRRFAEIKTYLREGDLLVLNNTRVVPARIFGRKSTGARVELLVVERRAGGAEGGEHWRCMLKPSRKARPGASFALDGGAVATVLGRDEEGFFNCEVTSEGGPGQGLAGVLEEHGHVPLPPYIRREDSASDRQRYQTVFAEVNGAVAAPTAGLHFTQSLLAGLDSMGVEVRFVTLHTGPGTFMPVRTDDPAGHTMLRERYSVDSKVFEDVVRAKKEGRRVIAVGSTSTRALEASVAGGFGEPRLEGATDLFIYPGFEFRVVDAMITNFHLPCSTLIMLVAAFAGRDLVMRAYGEAVRNGYRFYSYGDAMFLF